MVIIQEVMSLYEFSSHWKLTYKVRIRLLTFYVYVFMYICICIVLVILHCFYSCASFRQEWGQCSCCGSQKMQIYVFKKCYHASHFSVFSGAGENLENTMAAFKQWVETLVTMTKLLWFSRVCVVLILVGSVCHMSLEVICLWSVDFIFKRQAATP